MNKKIYLIRHAQSEANAAYDLANEVIYDAKITPLGKQQALMARDKLKNINFDLIVCSPLTRTLQTLSIIFSSQIHSTIILPFIREHLDNTSDTGRQPDILKKEFVNLNFDSLKNFWWNNNIPIDFNIINYESIEDLDRRVFKFKKWINARPEKLIAVVSHGTFISRITNVFLSNCEFKIWHTDN